MFLKMSFLDNNCIIYKEFSEVSQIFLFLFLTYCAQACDIPIVLTKLFMNTSKAPYLHHDMLIVILRFTIISIIAKNISSFLIFSSLESLCCLSAIRIHFIIYIRVFFSTTQRSFYFTDKSPECISFWTVRMHAMSVAKPSLVDQCQVGCSSFQFVYC